MGFPFFFMSGLYMDGRHENRSMNAFLAFFPYQTAAKVKRFDKDRELLQA